jgi:hypothetical protein
MVNADDWEDGMIRAIFTAALALLLFPMAALASQDDREDGVLPRDFEGKVAYFGNYTGSSSVLATQPRWAKDVPCPYQDHRCRKAIVGGGVKVVLEFRGERVIGFFYAVDGFRGPEGLKLGSLTGRRTPEGCELFQADGSIWRGRCDGREFGGQISTAAGIPNSFDVKFNTVAMHVRDLGYIRKQKWEAQRREQRIAGLRARVDSADPRESFFAAAELESYSWFPGGVDADRFPAPEWPRKFKNGRPYELRSDFPTPGGGSGWVLVRYTGSDFDCIASHRRPSCGPIRDPIPYVIESEDDPEGWFTADGRVITELRAAEGGTP